MVTEKQFPMTIGMILDSNFPPDPRVENEAVSLIKAGHEIHVLSFNYGEDWASEEMINGINVLSIEDIYIRKIYAVTGVETGKSKIGAYKFEGGRQDAKDLFDLYTEISKLSDSRNYLSWPFANNSIFIIYTLTFFVPIL
mgnify:CR=1 FL=1